MGSVDPSSGVSHCCSKLSWSLLASSEEFVVLLFGGGQTTSLSSIVETLGSSKRTKTSFNYAYCIYSSSNIKHSPETQFIPPLIDMFNEMC